MCWLEPSALLRTMLEEASVQTICPTAAAVAVADRVEGDGEDLGDAAEVFPPDGVLPAPVCERAVQATSVPSRTRTRRRLPVALKATDTWLGSHAETHLRN